MELVYLYIEKYKNIENKGFNFSPKFNCNFDGKNLNIEKKDNHLENFFGNNINITAIVGENGSGKSSILEVLLFNNLQLFDRKSGNNFAIFFHQNRQIFYINYDKNHKEIRLSEFKNNKIEITILLNKSLEIYKQEIISLYFDSSYKKFPLEIGNTLNILRNIAMTNYKKAELIENALFLLEQKAIKLPDEFPDIKNINISFIRSINNQSLSEYRYFKNLQVISISDKIRQILIYIFIEFGIIKDDNESNGNYKECKKDFLDVLEKEVFKSYQELYEFLEIYFLEKKRNTSPKNCRGTIGEFDNYFSKSNLLIESINQLKSKKNMPINKLPKKLMKNYINLIQNISEVQEFLEFDFQGLSSGQETFLFQFANFYKAIKDIGNNQNIFIFIDEGENTLHPNWQKKYISYLQSFLSENFNNNKFHIILTSHSPFILSDLPKENVIFLEDGKQKDIDINPFGANIHTLLSHGFFMQDGLIGDFAKGKIQDIIDFLNNKKTLDKISIPQNQIKPIIENIGEPFLRDKLLDKYNRKFIEDYKEREKEKINREIESLNQKLIELNK